MDSPTSWLTNPGWGELDNADDDDDREKNTIAAMLNQRDAEARAKQSEMMRRRASTTHLKRQLTAGETVPGIQERMARERKQLLATVPMGLMGKNSVTTYLWDLGLMEHTDSFEREFPGPDGADKLRVGDLTPQPPLAHPLEHARGHPGEAPHDLSRHVYTM
jgi:hypothetical protein